MPVGEEEFADEEAVGEGREIAVPPEVVAAVVGFVMMTHQQELHHWA